MVSTKPSTYFELEPEQNPFSTLFADITHRCNMECANCYLPNRVSPDMDTDKLRRFLDRLPRRTNIRVIGAEPTMREDLPAIIRMIRAAGHRPTLITNGLKLKREPYVAELVAAGMRSLALSVNGADDDEVYKLLDGGKYADVKMAAMDNCFKHNLLVGTNTILVRGINEHTTPLRLLRRVVASAARYGRHFKRTNPTMLRIKSVGEIGRFMAGESLSLQQLADCVCKPLGVSPQWALDNHRIYGHDEGNICVFPYETERGPLYIKLTDWGTNSEGVPNAGSRRRGRITQDWKVAPCFEHVKVNEGGY